MMTLKNMRENGTRYVALWCIAECGHHVEFCADDLPVDTIVREIGARYRCSKCGRPSPESRPAWHMRDGDPPGSI